MTRKDYSGAKNALRAYFRKQKEKEEKGRRLAQTVKIKADEDEKAWNQEKEKERQVIRRVKENLGSDYETTKLQNNSDDGGADGIIRHVPTNREIYIEARRKGWPSRDKKKNSIFTGWNDPILATGIYINEIIIQRYLKEDIDFFIYATDIKGTKGTELRIAIINQAGYKELLSQPPYHEYSYNTGKPQSVKFVPIKWFIPEADFASKLREYLNNH